MDDITEKNKETDITQKQAVLENTEKELNPKTEALLRYINDQVLVQKTAPVRKKTIKERIKEAVVGLFTILYMIAIHPFLSDKKLKNMLIGRILYVIIVILLAHWFSGNMFKPAETMKIQENAAKNHISESSSYQSPRK